MRYIDADKMIDGYSTTFPYNLDYCDDGDLMEWIESQPTADVAEVRHGHWTLHTDGSGTCSECGTTQKNIWDCDRWQNYCGHCGARMDGDDDD